MTRPAQRGKTAAFSAALKRLLRQPARDDVPEGLVYCRALDLYVDAQTKARAEALHFTEAHHALSR
jgi:hypothetical protein